MVAGFAACNFSVSGVGVITNDDTLTIPYAGNTCLGPVKGTETLRRRTNTPPSEPPPPTPPPPPAPSPPASAAPAGFDLSTVTVVGSPNVLGWPVTSRITSLSFGLAHAHGFPRGVIGVVLAGSWAAMLGVLRHHTRGLAAPIVAHVVADATIATVVLVLASE